MSGVDISRVEGPPWPAAEHAVALLFASTPTEWSVLESWVARSSPNGDVEVLAADDARLGSILATLEDDPEVVPLRLAWSVRSEGPGLPALLAGAVPPGPRGQLQEQVLRWRPDLAQVAVGEPATVGELRRRFKDATGRGDDEAFGAFVARQGVLALDRAERRRTGRPKVPRLVVEEVQAGAPFRQGIAELAGRLGRTEEEVAEEASGYLAEMVASQSPLTLEVFRRLGRFGARAYRLEVDAARLPNLRERGRRGALVFLPSHRSYLDPFVLRTALHEHGFPPNHVLGGVNVSFWPVGPLGRRSGLVFIRRRIRDNPVYRFVLRHYLGYLVTKRFNLEWYIEGGRTRTGKLRPPQLGLLAYLVDAFRQAAGEAGEVHLVPTSIVYDQLYEVGVMAAEEHGASKRPEGLGWAVGYARAQGRRLGSVHVRFGEPLPLGEALTAQDGSVEKLAFEVCHRINRVVPVTPTAVISLALLGVEDRALTLEEVRSVLGPLLEYLGRRGLGMAGGVDLARPEDVRATLDALARHGVLSCFGEGAEPVWAVERHLEAAFYRNGIAHFFVNRAIVELIAVRAAEEPPAEALEEAWEEALHLRDLLKFEFFFARKRQWAAELTDELAFFDPDWAHRATQPKEVWACLTSSRLYLAHRVLRSFLEAYLVAAERLATCPPEEAVSEDAFVSQCLGLARQWRLQHRIGSTESISAELFRNALRLAANRGLLPAGNPELAERRAAFAHEVGAVVARIGKIRDAAVADLGPVESMAQAEGANR